MPLAGDAVTDTRAPAGRNGIWSGRFLSGSSSKIGSARAVGERRPGRRIQTAPARQDGHQTSESGMDALVRAMKSSRASSIAGSSGGASYSASCFFQMALARWAASREPSSCHCS